MLYQVSVFHSFSLLSNSPLCVYTTFQSSILLLMDICVVFTFWFITNNAAMNIRV